MGLECETKFGSLTLLQPALSSPSVPSPAPTSSNITMSAALQLQGLYLVPWQANHTRALMAACYAIVPAGSARVLDVAFISSTAVLAAKRRRLLATTTTTAGNTNAAVPTLALLTQAQKVVVQVVFSAPAANYDIVYAGLAGGATTGLLATTVRTQGGQAWG